MMPGRGDAAWKLVFASVAGTAHHDGLCQDHADGRIIAGAEGPILIAAVADGAGSASHSERGAKAAVAAFLAAAEAGATIDPSAITTAQAHAWMESARNRIECESATLGVPLRQLACTLLTAVVGPTSAMFAQVGDGAIVFDAAEADGYAYAFWPDSGEYANTTRFLTDLDYASRIRFDRIDRPVRSLAMLTDGLQMLALDYAGGRVHARFFDPLFEVVGASTDGEALRAGLIRFLTSRRINERTDDDKTLLLATRGGLPPGQPDDPAPRDRHHDTA